MAVGYGPGFEPGRAVCLRSLLHRHILPALLSFPPSRAVEGAVLRESERGRGCRLSRLFTVPASRFGGRRDAAGAAGPGVSRAPRGKDCHPETTGRGGGDEPLSSAKEVQADS